MCLMGIVQNLFLAYENPLLMKYIIPENIFVIPDIWVWSNMAGSYPILNQIFRRGKLICGGVAEVCTVNVTLSHPKFKKLMFEHIVALP